MAIRPALRQTSDFLARRKSKARKLNPDKHRGDNAGSKPQLKLWPLYLIIIVLFVLYIFVQRFRAFSLVIGITLFFLIIIVIVLEVINGTKESGYKKSLAEIGIAILIVVIFWYGLKFILQTNDPIDVVPSCSMLPYLHRGDMIALQGVKSVGEVKAPVVDVTKAQMSSMLSDINSETLECVAYNTSASGTSIDQIIKPGYKVGLLENTPEGYSIVSNSSQKGNLVEYACGSREVQLADGQILNEAYTTSIRINNVTISGDRNNSIIVYRTDPNDSFYKEGDLYIVHRVYAVLNASGEYYFLTKGDNNPGLDMQYDNYPASISNVSGKVIGVIPYLGYLKLILSNDIIQPAGCNSTVLH